MAGEEGVPNAVQNRSLASSFYCPHTAPPQGVYEHMYKWEAGVGVRGWRRGKETQHPIFLFCSFSVFKEQMCRGLQTEKDTPSLSANLG